MAKGSEDIILIKHNLYKTKFNLQNCIVFACAENNYCRHYKPSFSIECSKEGGVL